ncbi:MAG: RNA methyltransferase [Planctomycetes bacterium]|nr:RNA methyltransferase [Planctomycetota bacterium]
MISSLQNRHVKQAIKLRDRRQRQKQGRFLINGGRELLRAIQAGVPLAQAFVCERLCTTDDARAALAAIPSAAAEVLPVSAEVFAKLAFGDRAEGVLGVAELPKSCLEELCLPPQALVAVLEGVEKPGNVGAVLRSADGAGISAVIVADGGTDLYNPNTIRASLGTIFARPIVSATTSQTISWLRQTGLTIYAAQTDAPRRYTSADFTQPAAIVLGSESQGLGRQWLEADIIPIRVPMQGIADSLNVSAAAAVLFYEALRQRT